MANVGGEEYGPFTWDQMLDMAAQGRVTPELPIRKVSDSQWSTAAAIPGLLGGTRPAAPKPAAKVAAAAAKSGIKKAKPLARPPAARPAPPVVGAPQNIPVGVPVGSPVGVAVGSPASSSGAFNFDLNSSPSGKQRTVKKSVLDDDDDIGGKQKSNTPLILGALGGVAALVAVLVGLTIYMTMFRGGNEEKLAATNTSTEEQTEPEDPAESNPGGAEGEGEIGAKKANATQTKTEKGAKGSSPDIQGGATKEQIAIVQGIREWKNIVTLKSVGIGNARVAISRVWLATDATGKRAALPGAGAAKDDANKAKFVFVEIALSNKAGAAIKYKGWNNTSINGALLADEKNQILPLVAKAETPGVARLDAADIPGSGSIAETLVFQAPPGPFEALHLVLPQAVFYSSIKGKYFSLEITPDVLANEGGAPVVTPPPTIASGEGTDPLVAGRKVPTDPATPEGVIPAQPATPAPAAVVKTEEPPPPKKPSLIDEINKDFETREKGKKTDEGKGAEPAKTEPAKKPAPAKSKAK
jgi:hypothetical protein